jgi:FKBP-type peptidyl-prolyl cis-trans isomerase 2
LWFKPKLFIKTGYSELKNNGVDTMKIKEGSKVSVEYTGTLEDGTVFDTNKGKEPLVFEVGEKKIITGYEKNIIGMEKGQSKKITLKPEDAYGPVNEKLMVKIPKQSLQSKGVDAKEGMKVKMEPKDQNYPPRIATIKKVEGDTIILDLNHPLAGKTLIFEVKIVDVK